MANRDSTPGGSGRSSTGARPLATIAPSPSKAIASTASWCAATAPTGFLTDPLMDRNDPCLSCWSNSSSSG